MSAEGAYKSHSPLNDADDDLHCDGTRDQKPETHIYTLIYKSKGSPQMKYNDQVSLLISKTQSILADNNACIHELDGKVLHANKRAMSLEPSRIVRY